MGSPSLAHDWRTPPDLQGFLGLQRLVKPLLEREGRGFLQPALELADGNHDSAAASDHAELGPHVLVEVVAGDADRGGGFVECEGEPGRAHPARSSGGRSGSRLPGTGSAFSLQMTGSRKWFPIEKRNREPVVPSSGSGNVPGTFREPVIRCSRASGARVASG